MEDIGELLGGPAGPVKVVVAQVGRPPSGGGAQRNTDCGVRTQVNMDKGAEGAGCMLYEKGKRKEREMRLREESVKRQWWYRITGSNKRRFTFVQPSDK